MLIASVLRTFEGFAALSGAASFFRGLHRPFGGSIVVSFGRGFGGGCGRGLGCWCCLLARGWRLKGNGGVLREVIRAGPCQRGWEQGTWVPQGRGWSGTVIMIIIFLFPFSYKIIFRYKSSPKEGEVKKKKCSESSTQPYIVPVKMFKYVRKVAEIEVKYKTCTIICVTCVKMTNANDLQ
jgi:hypothetical protein